MLFLSPWLLLGLLAAAVPPLLHLFQRRRPPEFVFPAVRYLRQTEREAERSLKLRHLLLMILRMAAVVLLTLAAARPVVPRGGGGGGGALHEPTALALVLDYSLSAGAIGGGRGGGRPVLEELALRAGETLRAAQPGDALWVIGPDLLPRRGTAGELLEHVGALAPDARRLDLAAAAALGARLVAGSGYARGELHVLSDFQSSALDSARAPDSAAADLPVLLYHPAEDPPPNRGVTAAVPRPALWLAGLGGGSVAGGGSSGAVEARLGGGPPLPASGGATVTLTLGGRPGGRALAGGGSEGGDGVVVLAAPPAAPGWRAGQVALDPDELRADDTRPFAVRVVAPAAADIDPASDPGPFVREAVAALVDAGQLRAGRGAGGGGVRIGGPGGAGGGRAAVVFPPSDAGQVGAVNRMLAAAGAAWRFGALVQREDSLSGLAELAGARVRARYRLEAPGAAGDSDAVVARAGADPWIVKDGAVVLVGSRMAPEVTDLPVSGAFVPFISALVNRVARGEAAVLSAAPGDPVLLPGRATHLAADSLVPVEGGAVIAAPAAPGVYAVLAGADTMTLLVVAADPRESDLSRAEPRALARLLPGARVTVATDERTYAMQRFRGAGRSELTGALLLAALVVLILEAAVASGRFSPAG